MRIILSRVDSIGDAILVLPMASILKQHFPGAHITYLGTQYVEALIDASCDIDRFMNWTAISKQADKEIIDTFLAQEADIIFHIRSHKKIAWAAKKAGIKCRIGTFHRLYHLLTCNKLVNYSRRKSSLHESVLNLKLLAGLKLKTDYSCSDLIPHTRLQAKKPLPSQYGNLVSNDRFNLILHPGSRGSSREWPVDSFKQLISSLPPETFTVFITGVAEEASRFSELTSLPNTINLIGKLDIGQLISFIYRCDGLIAASTGPLHIAAALGVNTLGLYAAIPKIHPHRWGPIGKQAQTFLAEPICNFCQDGLEEQCQCMKAIKVTQVEKVVSDWLVDKNQREEYQFRASQDGSHCEGETSKITIDSHQR